jgi:hypothetical protein
MKFCGDLFSGDTKVILKDGEAVGLIMKNFLGKLLICFF